MAEETAPTPNKTPKNALDLDSLAGLSFGPAWADERSVTESKRKGDYNTQEDKGRRGASPASRDRRSGKRPSGGHGGYGGQGGQGGFDKDRGDRTNRNDRFDRNDKGDRNGRTGERRGETDRRRQTPAVFEPTVSTDLYPQDEAFDALVKRLRASARTYQLFDIAHLLLEKPERYMLVVSPRQASQSAEQKKPLLYYSVPQHLPFESEEEAIDYVLKEHIDLFFDVEEIEVDPPTGNFLMVNRCTLTGELLGPPNYHRYQEFVQRHYATRINGMTFEHFQSKIQGSREQADIDAWLESMKKAVRYTVKDRAEGEPESLLSVEAARRFLTTHRKDKVVGSSESVRFAGRDIERLPRGNLRRSVEHYVEQQKHFPLDTANNIRGRLRRHKFAVYKRGSKGVSYVCAVKRKFRDSKTTFTDSIRDLIDFIEKHPDIPAAELSKLYIGIDLERQKPETLEMKEGQDAETSGPEAEAPTGVEAASASATATASANATASASASELKTVADHVAPESIATPESEAPTVATPKQELSETEQKRLNQLMIDLRWLITEGYVTEYGDGSLFAPAPLPEPTRKATPPSSNNLPEHGTNPNNDDDSDT